MLGDRGRGRRHFHDELDSLQERLVEMAGRVEQVILMATDGVLQRDSKVSKRVRKSDDEIDEIELEIDERAMELLALHQPMAKDLRQILTTLKVSNDLERVGDHGVNIAKATKRLARYPTLPELPELEEMIEITRGMLADALAAFISRNPGTAEMVVERDEKVDNLRRSLFRILVTHMLEDPTRISPALELILVTQNLERIADLASNIAEDVVFLVMGRTIPRPDDDSD